jgi:hypothetical protein
MDEADVNWKVLVNQHLGRALRWTPRDHPIVEELKAIMALLAAEMEAEPADMQHRETLEVMHEPQRQRRESRPRQA